MMGVIGWLWVVMAGVASASSENTSSSDCPSHGCHLVPLDVINHAATKAAIEGLRTHTDTANALAVLASAGNADRVVLTLKGYKGGDPADQINQDSATILSPYYITGVKEENTHTQLLGIFDGHGNLGEITSAHASREIPRLLAEKFQSLERTEDSAAVRKAIQDVFVQVDQTDPTGGVGGATATMILQRGHRLYVANAGDSRSFVAVVWPDGTSQVVYASREDKPELPDERRRIMEAGGYVHIPKNSNEDVPRAYYVDPEGRARFGLAMSRSIGDWKVQGVIPEPIVDVLNVATLVKAAIASHAETCHVSAGAEEKKEEDHIECQPLEASDIQIMAISASDGMIDFLELEDIAAAFAEAFFAKDDESPHPFVAAEHLILSAAHGWDVNYRGEYRDDIAVSACKVILNDQILEEGSLDSDEDRDEL